MLLVWHTVGAFGENGGHLVNWLIVRVCYCITDFTMLNTVNLGRFVTLTLGHFATPQQVLHWLVVNSECDVGKFNLSSHNAQAKV